MGNPHPIPQVLYDALDALIEKYDIQEIIDPVDAKVLGRNGKKLCAMLETSDDIIGIDFYVIPRNPDDIPGVRVRESWSGTGRKTYYDGGIGSGGGHFLSEDEVERRRPGTHIRFEISTAETDFKYIGKLQTYKNHDVATLVQNVSKGLKEAGLE